MPGPGPHMMYAMGSGQALMRLTNGRFSPHHCLTFVLNSFFGPDIGSFAEWLAATLGLGQHAGSAVFRWIHHPFYYVFILGFPLSLLYSYASRLLLRMGYLDSISGVSLTKRQCFMLICAGSLTHFFLDHLFEDNGQSTTYLWIMSTGWWEGRAPINPDAVIIVGFLCTCLIAGFIYNNRVNSLKSLRKKSNQTIVLMLVIATIYCLWCASQIYLVDPRRPAVGEEADLGVIVFLSLYFFLPHWLCITSMNSAESL